ncbi:hypothetical protein [Paraburkholderia sp. DGU8]|jgi:hypothetical protein|uniref:hypothetical protein n=1 Tax=Paraburkholderia sp. DGU8 TaxID=3161997 RepID=UPI0034676857
MMQELKRPELTPVVFASVPEIRLRNAAVLTITFGVFVAVAADATKRYFEGVYHYFSRCRGQTCLPQAETSCPIL